MQMKGNPNHNCEFLGHDPSEILFGICDAFDPQHIACDVSMIAPPGAPIKVTDSLHKSMELLGLLKPELPHKPGDTINLPTDCALVTMRPSVDAPSHKEMLENPEMGEKMTKKARTKCEPNQRAGGFFARTPHGQVQVVMGIEAVSPYLPKKDKFQMSTWARTIDIEQARVQVSH